MFSAPTAPSASLVPPGNAAWTDPVTYQILAANTLVDWSFTTPLPALPALAGLSIHLQAWFLPPAILPAATSNGLRLVFGL